MLANFLNKSKPINFIGLLIFFFVCFSISVFFTEFTDGFSLDKLLKSACLLILFLSIFFFFNFIVNKNKITFDNTYAYFLFTILITCILKDLTNYYSLILAIIYLLFLRKVYSLRTTKDVIQKLFDSGFWLGILFILEPLSILFLMIIFIGIYLHQKINLHTLFTPLIGFVTPVFVYFTYFFWFDKTEEFTNLFDFNCNFNVQFYNTPKYILFICSILIISLFSAIFKSIETVGVSNTFRKSWYLLLVNFATVLLFLLFTPIKNGAELFFILVPTAVIIANGIELIKKKIIKDLLLYVFLIGSIFISFFL